MTKIGDMQPLAIRARDLANDAETRLADVIDQIKGATNQRPGGFSTELIQSNIAGAKRSANLCKQLCDALELKFNGSR